MIDFIFSSGFDWFIAGIVFTYACQWLGRIVDRAIERRKVQTITIAGDDIELDPYDKAVLDVIEHNKDRVRTAFEEQL